MLHEDNKAGANNVKKNVLAAGEQMRRTVKLVWTRLVVSEWEGERPSERAVAFKGEVLTSSGAVFSL